MVLPGESSVVPTYGIKSQKYIHTVQQKSLTQFRVYIKSTEFRLPTDHCNCCLSNGSGDQKNTWIMGSVQTISKFSRCISLKGLLDIPLYIWSAKSSSHRDQSWNDTNPIIPTVKIRYDIHKFLPAVACSSWASPNIFPVACKALTGHNSFEIVWPIFR